MTTQLKTEIGNRKTIFLHQPIFESIFVDLMISGKGENTALRRHYIFHIRKLCDRVSQGFRLNLGKSNKINIFLSLFASWSLELVGNENINKFVVVNSPISDFNSKIKKHLSIIT